MKKIKIGLLGLGNIGTGTYKTLDMNRSEVESAVGTSVEIVKILERDKDKDRGIVVPDEKFTTDPDEIFNDPEIDIVIELIGGIEPATTFMLTAMEHGKHVVTANKAAVAANYDKLMDTAKKWCYAQIRSQRRRRHPDPGNTHRPAESQEIRRSPGYTEWNYQLYTHDDDKRRTGL
ncbi:MAG: Gfo/Idh/MocA family oxidoreductase [Anaerovoracaceae bacterium]